MDNSAPALPPRHPGWLAAGLAAACPVMATCGSFLTLAAVYLAAPEIGLAFGIGVWVSVALITALAGGGAAFLLWRAVRRGTPSSLPLLALAAVPWALSLPLEILRLRFVIRQFMEGAGMGVFWSALVEGERIVGLFATWSLTGGVGLGLAVAALAWRAGRPRFPDIAVGVASLLPLLAWVTWHLATHQLVPPSLEAGLFALVLLAAPVHLGLAGASPPSGTGVAPGDRFRLAVPAALFLAFLAASTVYVAFATAGIARAADLALMRASIEGAENAQRDAILADLSSVRAFRAIGALLALVPLLVFAARGSPRTLVAPRVLVRGFAAAAVIALLVVADTRVFQPGTRELGVLLDRRPLEEAVAAPIPGASDAQDQAPAPPPPPPPAIEPAAVVDRALPQFPPGALAPGERRMVVLAIEIDEAGNVTKVSVVRSASAALDDAAIEAALASRFRPATRNGVPVRTTQGLTYQFVGN